MYKFLSDIDMHIDGRFGIEWELATGGRYWEYFDTEEERKQALDEHEKLRKES